MDIEKIFKIMDAYASHKSLLLSSRDRGFISQSRLEYDLNRIKEKYLNDMLKEIGKI